MGRPGVRKPSVPMIAGVTVKTLGAVPPWYGRGPRTGAVAEGRADPDSKADAEPGPDAEGRADPENSREPEGRANAEAGT